MFGLLLSLGLGVTEFGVSVGSELNPLISGLAVVVAAALTSGGLWSYLQKRDTKKDATQRLLLGLAHDRIIFLGMSYLSRGYLTKDEYEDFVKYLWEPYSEFGGNGLAEKVFREVSALPIVAYHPPKQEVPVTVETKETG